MKSGNKQENNFWFCFFRKTIKSVKNCGRCSHEISAVCVSSNWEIKTSGIGWISSKLYKKRHVLSSDQRRHTGKNSFWPLFLMRPVYLCCCSFCYSQHHKKAWIWDPLNVLAATAWVSSSSTQHRELSNLTLSTGLNWFYNFWGYEHGFIFTLYN